MKKIRFTVLILALGILLSAFLSVGVFAEEEVTLISDTKSVDTKQLLSRGLLHIYKNKAMAKSGVFGNDIYFEKKDFQRVFNLSDAQFRSITVSRAPSATDGELRIGSCKIVDGQRISAENIAYLTFVPASDNVSIASFSFSVNDDACDVSCELYFTEKENSAPIVSKTVSAYNSAMTYSSYTHQGRLASYDADGDAVKYVIVKYPENGSVVISDMAKGKYEYVHKKGFTGKDSFSYCAVDKYGNWSDSVSVSIEVRAKDKDAESFADLEKYENKSAVLYVTESDVMSGTVVGNTNYFYPEKTVSRAEFVVMAMHALGMDKDETVLKTSFADDAEIASYMKGYVQRAYEKGYVTGNFKDAEIYFEPDAPITKADAVAILGAMTDFEKGAFGGGLGESYDVPAWAEDSFETLVSLGIVELSESGAFRDSALTKMDCAEIFSKIMIIKNTD